ncbi:MAG TPA: poly-gamma-glutamate biosynthesis protein PgsC [Candidatus Syntrophosphaera thermopropionivorans]|uniref:Poly-gamma-glutamate biosynthesis protein PgsC n=1 Tax=Candidatus Syntrophosphaera thermopropionivorans TaxID=2593015 RepID=A0AC61QHN2_9BACT|nr:poly-gamma-glutamate biosynthesis protein PgsC [Candidatus Syntrophosphaera thermopropionivorans]MBP7899544.1 poly-gamma-glutamate biosynthesis protein PgsC [Candidatus Syntrophosphaera sp.]MBP9007016.1 poly-gamma-glutamate biosynthesis protein PgsC [Candidatus Syntrophosphaera sp.]TDF72475.1 poly-gamma-glutamate biosynthesis protein PgsC [Candidatus Syntrophosphaera thermopropionivorans]HNU97909.1 poly-gamma-glutamate biosynthesis protein PgsC [Candidatus Syntrophosphaera thermopropionivora
MVESIIQAAVGLGVIISLLFSELLGASAGGIVVPGYIAMYLDRPMQILGTIVVSLLTWGIIRLISNFTLLFGKRRMVLSILVGFILGWASRLLVYQNVTVYTYQLQSIGYIIPGLIANWFERQGFWKTITSLGVAAVLVRLILMVVFKGEL